MVTSGARLSFRVIHADEMGLCGSPGLENWAAVPKFGRRRENSAEPSFFISLTGGIQPLACGAFRAGKEFGRRGFGHFHFRPDLNSADRFGGISGRNFSRPGRPAAFFSGRIRF
jgi:hypothetical protein